MNSKVKIFIALVAVAVCALTLNESLNNHSVNHKKVSLTDNPYEFNFVESGKIASNNPRNGQAFLIEKNGFSISRGDINIFQKIHSLPEFVSWEKESPNIIRGLYSNLEIEYINTQQGFRQNFVFNKPEQDPTSVYVNLEFTGQDKLELDSDENLYCYKNGEIALIYNDLLAYDAHGKELEASISMTENGYIRLTANTSNAVFPVTIDPLSTTPDWTFESDQDGANMGFAVSTAGDVNNDGYDDVVVGAAAYDNGQMDEGKAYLFLGSPTGLATSPVWDDEGDNTGGLMGKSVAAAGDVNGDGFGDMLIALGLYSGGESQEGRAHLHYGNATGVSTEPDWTFEPNQPGVGLGFPLEGLGDVNGDGYDDVAIGGNGWDGDLSDEGKVYVFYGSDTGLATIPDWTVEGDNANAKMGHGVSAAGDVNNDGYNDLLIGGWNYSGAVPNCGKALVYLGGPSGLSTTPVWELEGDQSNAYFAFWVSGVGDVNGDNYDDIMIGAKRYDATFVDEGRAWLFLGGPDGPSETPAWSQKGNNDGAEYSNQFGPAGDVNNDGYDDVVVGSHFHQETFVKEGMTYVYLGGPSGLNTSAAWTFLGGQNQANMGWSCDGAGDVNGDGYDDIITGAFKYSNPDANEGSAFVFHGLAECSAPSGYSVDMLGPTSADVSWTGSPSADNYRIRLRSSAGNLAFVSPVENFTITGLTPSTFYRSIVQANCGGEWSNRSNIIAFTTPPMRTGIVEETTNVYPNPATDWVYFTTPKDIDGDVVIEIYSLDGQLVQSLNAGSLEQNTQLGVDISNISMGNYIYRLSCGNYVSTGIINKQ